MWRNNSCKRITRDHRPSDPDEEKRISDLGGKVTTKVDKMTGKVISRVNGILSVWKNDDLI